MTAWWQTLTTLQQLYYTIAIPATVLLLLQTALLLIGFGHDGDAGGGMDHSGGFDHDGGFDHGGFDHDFDHDGGLDPGAGELPDHDFSHMGADDSLSGVSHADVADLRLFSLRGVIAFFVMTGWTGVLFANVLPPWLTALLALAMGFAGLYLTAKLFQWSGRLQQSGNIHWEKAVGSVAEVYLPVPAMRKGSGKVMVLIQERLSEKEAITDSKQTLATGLQVRVREVLRDGRLVVEPLRNDRQ